MHKDNVHLNQKHCCIHEQSGPVEKYKYHDWEEAKERPRKKGENRHSSVVATKKLLVLLCSGSALLLGGLGACSRRKIEANLCILEPF